ncbi:MAG TPA: nucleotide disphospho-sugar-binding domain-containing protein [Micromonosporaceae bacterium]|jgi:UDP:flavonoid glycosyltransferase YjiC (YdhE family)
MSRFLISTMPATGHVNPAAAVATALTARGHEVLWHTGPAYRDTVERSGAAFVAARRTPSFEELPPRPDPGTRGAAEAVSALRKLLVDRMAGQLADYEEILQGYAADAIVVDLCALGGRALHERHGIPWATLGISPLTAIGPDTPPFGTGWPPPRGSLGRARIRVYNRLGGLFMRGLTAAYSERRAALGLPPLPRGVTTFDHMMSSELHLQAATPSIEYPRRPWPANVHLVGPLLPPVPSAMDTPQWWDELAAARTVVHVTQGTYATDPGALTRPTVEALAELDGLVVVTTPDPDALGPVPANACVAPSIPHGLLLPHVDVMVSNAGYNGVKAALAHGVPLVLAPWGNDQPDVAARIAWAGAAVNLGERTPAPAAIGGAVARVLAEPSYREAARRIADEFREYGTGERAAVLLESLVAEKVRTRH